MLFHRLDNGFHERASFHFGGGKHVVALIFSVEILPRRQVQKYDIVEIDPQALRVIQNVLLTFAEGDEEHRLILVQSLAKVVKSQGRFSRTGPPFQEVGTPREESPVQQMIKSLNPRFYFFLAHG